MTTEGFTGPAERVLRHYGLDQQIVKSPQEFVFKYRHHFGVGSADDLTRWADSPKVKLGVPEPKEE